MRMKLCTRSAIGAFVLVFIGSGCGSGSGTTPTEGKVDAGPNSRIKFKDEYKKMIGKDGQLLFKPGTSGKRPPGIPKKP